MTKDIALFDLDGTIALVEHRAHFIESRPKNWHGYFAACVDDPPNEPVIEILQALQTAGYEIWIASGRSDEVRSETEQWLRRQRITWTKLLMRAAGDLRPDDVLKRGWLRNGSIPKERVRMVFDDRDRIVAMWRRHGLVCLQVAPGDF